MSEKIVESTGVPTQAEFRDVMGRFASGVTIITTRNGGEDYGATVSAVSSLTDDPPMLLVCLNVSSNTGQAVKDSGKLVVNVLAEDSGPIAYRFASKEPDKFSLTPFERGVDDLPLIAGSIAHFECEVEEVVRGGTHYVFLARVRKVHSYQGDPLAYFRGSFGRMEMNTDAVTLSSVRDYVVSRVTEESLPIDAEVVAEELQLEIGRTFNALIALTREGIVSRKGTTFTVEPIPDSVLFDYYSAKLSIELGVAAQTVGKVSDEQLAEFRRLMEATLEYVDGDRFTDTEGWIETNAAFHEYMVGFADSVIIEETYKGLRLPSVERRAISEMTRATAELINDHRAILEGYEAGDVDRVLQTLIMHAKRPRETRSA